MLKSQDNTKSATTGDLSSCILSFFSRSSICLMWRRPLTTCSLSRATFVVVWIWERGGGREEGENSVAPTRVISGGCWGVLGVGGDVSSALSIWKSFVHTCQPLCNLLARRFCSCGFVGTRNARGVGAYHVGLSDQRHVRARARRGEGW